MDNNQFNNQYNNYGQQPVQPQYQQPVQQPYNNYGQPAYQQPVQPVYGQQPKKANTGLIVGIVIAVIVAIGVFSTVGGGSSKKIDGKWTCVGSKGTLIINADASAKTVKMNVGTFGIDAKYKSSGTVKPAQKKDGYKYTQYVFTSGSNTTGSTYSSSKKVGFVFGIDSKDSNKGHYIDSTKAGSLEFTCTKVN